METLVGREQQLAVIDAALDEATAGHGRLVMLTGEPGIGKTSLADAATPRATARGFRVFWGRCWESGGVKTLQMNPSTALSGRTKELIGLAVAAQVPCHYCIVGHTEFARLDGASDREIGEAVAMAAITRHWSTFLNGSQTDEAQFRGEIMRLVENAKKASGAKTSPGAAVAVTDGASALREVSQLFGFTPEFLKRFPDEARAGAWKQMRDVQMSPSTALSGKNKELIGLAVAAQIPCRLCVIGHTEFARLNGATDAEIGEALAMASLTRSMSTLLNGLQIDEGQFRRDVERLVKGAQAAAKTSPASPRSRGRSAP